MTMEDLIGLSEAAKILKCTVQHARNLMKSDLLFKKQIGRVWMVNRSEVERLAHRRKWMS